MDGGKPRRDLAAGRALRFGAARFGLADETERRNRRWRVYRAAGLMLAAVVVGTGGYYLLSPGEHDLLTALYMTVITISTVGFNEVIPIHDSDQLILFTIGLMVMGVAATFYFFTSVMAMVVEGDPLFLVWRRRMKQSIDDLSDHVVVAGVGSNGIHALRELWSAAVPLVVIESDANRLEQLLAEFGEGLLHLIGDAHEDAVLEAAGLARARGLIATLHDDRDNLFLCLAARTINADLRIVAKAQDSTSAEKFRRAGVNAVVSPSLIGGRRLAREMVHPHVTSFFDGLFGHGEAASEIDELVVEEGCAVAGLSCAEADLPGRTGCLLIGIRDSPEERYRFSPSNQTVLAPGIGLMVAGDPGQIRALGALVASPS